MNNKIIGLNVKKFRKERHLTQEALAERLDISTVHMSHIEGGSVSMSLALLLQLCEALDVAPNQVLEGAYTLSKEKNKPASEDILKGLTPECRVLCLEFIDLVRKSRVNRSKRS